MIDVYIHVDCIMDKVGIKCKKGVIIMCTDLHGHFCCSGRLCGKTIKSDGVIYVKHLDYIFVLIFMKMAMLHHCRGLEVFSEASYMLPGGQIHECSFD